MRSKEYDEFGPWTYEIKEADDIPRLFRPYPLDIKNSCMMIKIPRRIERADANPTMDLYDYLLDAQDDRIILLKRLNDSFETHVINYDDIKAIVNSIDLLRGTLTFYIHGQTLVIPYNSCSGNVIHTLIALIRQKYLHKSVGERIPEPVAFDEKAAEFAMRSYHNSLVNKFGDLTLIAMQNRHRVTLVKNNLFVSLFRLIFPVEILSAHYYSSGNELVILSQGIGVKKDVFPIHAIAYTFIPLSNISSVSQSNSSEYRSLVNLQIKTATETFEFAFDEANEQRENVAGLVGA